MLAGLEIALVALQCPFDATWDTYYLLNIKNDEKENHTKWKS
jgi:hypothetical protein